MADTGLHMGTTKGRWVLFATVLGSGLAMLDATVVNVALGRIGRDFDAGFDGLQWTVNAYALTLAALILLGGSLGDRFGRRRLFVIGTIWFAAASLLCGIAPSIEALVAARALQGVGGALLTPGSLAIISASFAHKDRAAAVGAWSGLGGIAAAIGPFVGGWLVEWSWRSVFLVNVPVAVLIVWVAARHVPESKDPEASPHLDIAGTVLGAVGLGGLTYALIAASGGVTQPAVLVTGTLGVLALIGFIEVERRSTHPLVPLDLFANRQFNAANAVTLMVYGAMGGVFFLLVLQLQVVAGFSPLAAGTALLPVTIIMLLLSSRAGALAQRIGPRIPMTAGPIVSALGLLLTLRVDSDASYLLDVVPAVIVFGLGLSLTVAPLTATVLGAAEDRHAGVASGVNNAVARAASLLAVAVIPVAAGITGADYTNPSAFDSGYRIATVVSAVLLAIGGVLSFLYIRQPMLAKIEEEVAPAEVPALSKEIAEPEPARIALEECWHCGVSGPQVHPRVEPGGGTARAAR